MQHFAFVEILATCARCGSSLPVAALAQNITCSHCLGESPVDASVYRFALTGLAQRLPSFGVGGFERIAGEGSLAKVEVRRGLGGPPCARCNETLVCPEAGGAAQCRACAAPFQMEVTPAWFRSIAPDVAYFSASRSIEPPKNPVATACVHCGAPLTVDGSARSVPCGHCGVTSVLPDAVWSIFHPPRSLAPIHFAIDLPSLDKPLPSPWGIVWIAGTAAVFLFATLALWAVILGVVSLSLGAEMGGPSLAPYFELGWAGLVGLACLTMVAFALRRAWRQNAARLAVNELVGRIHDTGARVGSYRVVDIALEAPDTPGTVLTVVRGKHQVAEHDWLRLGGEGAAVRAWAHRTGAVVGEPSVLFEPSRLLVWARRR